MGQFHVLDSKQIEAIFFGDNTSLTAHTRSMKFLREHKLVRRLERRTVDVEQGGSGAWVYCLDTAGHRFVHRGGVAARIYPRSRRTAHTLAVVDDLAAMMTLERGGKLQIESWEYEPRWTHESGVEVRPDLDVRYTQYGEERHVWIESDLGTERRADLLDKFSRYRALRDVVGGYEEDGETVWVEPFPFPWVVFTVPDEYRRNEIRREIERYEWREPIQMSVVLVSELPQIMV